MCERERERERALGSGSNGLHETLQRDADEDRGKKKRLEWKLDCCSGGIMIDRSSIFDP